MNPGQWKSLPWHPKVRVLDSDDEWVAVEKPAGVLSHPNGPGDRGRCLLRAPWEKRTESYRPGEGPDGGIGLCHRLDGPTSGVILLAAGEGVGRLRRAFEDGRIRKRYWAVVVGRPEQRRFLWRDRLVKEKEGGKVRVRVGSSGREAETRGEEKDFRRDPLPLALLLLEPGTGRTHQLRVQAARHGLPILGDRNYGDFGANRVFRSRFSTRRLFLHAWDLRWTWKGREARVAAEVPGEFVSLFSAAELTS
ncbi:MAG: RluA family pseudouridine synthase [Puniceicoccaceae bacterium]